MDRRTLLDCLHAADFTRLFIACGWSNPTAADPWVLDMGGTPYAFREAAQLKGFRVFVCRVPVLPDLATCRWLDSRLRKRSHDYLAVYLAPHGSAVPMHHLWAVPVTAADKRQLVKIEYISDDQAAFLGEKLDAISFSFDETPSILDVAARVNAAFLVNAAEVTKRFYREFRTQHDLFVKGIQGLSDRADRDWYASVMLNRLMFCYFIQKRGFLDGDPDYLATKLAWVRLARGANHFQSFYRSFLLRLFREGLDTPASSRPSAWNTADFGRIPYLNGGMFAEHPLEKDNPSLDIPDETFERLFDFFDQWRWHLDTRITASGRDINPDVLGYIFEQYINDRAEMGAYYTKEDITEYIGRSTILPWLLSETARKGHGDLFAALPDSGDRYIFPALLKGADLPLPPEIAAGVPPEPAATLRARRVPWNRPADPAFALPTEIWRETIARRNRVAELRRTIRSGAVRSPDDFVTLNLDIRAFAEDLLRETTDHLLVRHFHDALRRVTILDPTCGSGAFLFAALDILEPLYDACLDRMEEFHAANPRLFKAELAELAGARNRQYHIYKSIILRNLHGVDLMHEATEIARLRLFLKLVSAVDPDTRDPNLGLDPLPDIDFNIRTGNTLVGFANPDDVKASITPPGSLAIFGDEYRKIEVQAQDTADIYERFKALQLSSEGTAEFHDAKKQLDARLSALNETLDHALARSVFQIPPSKFHVWKAKSQPFHWFSDFYAITVAGKGFDIIIGNPPYVEYSTVSDYTIKGYKTEECGDLYAFIMEKAYSLLKETGRFGMIVPISIFGVNGFKTLQTVSRQKLFHIWNTSWANRPSQLFDAQKRLSIVLGIRRSRGDESEGRFFTSSYYRWKKEAFETLFTSRIAYIENPAPCSVFAASFEKFGSKLEIDAFAKLLKCKTTVGTLESETGSHFVYYTRKFNYFLAFLDFIPKIHTIKGHFEVQPSELKSLAFETNDEQLLILAALSSSTFFWFWNILSDCRNMNRRDLLAFPIPLQAAKAMRQLAQKYIRSLKATSYDMQKSGLFIQTFRYSNTKPILDEIDALLARHYGFTEEELDYIINYDIKYRMGDRLDTRGEQDD